MMLVIPDTPHQVNQAKKWHRYIKTSVLDGIPLKTQEETEVAVAKVQLGVFSNYREKEENVTD